MYEEYFGLKRKPFSIVPDPACFFMSAGHREALAHLLYSTTGEGGFVLLTGEVGTGKTTVCRRFIELIPEGTEVAFILNPKLTAEELLAEICSEFGIDCPEGTTSIRSLVSRINDYLLAVHGKGRRAVLILEEAQNLSPEALEQIRLLTNLETTEQKLLQVIMIGQPELRDMLSAQQLRQLSQRITARYHLGPLSRREVPGYIDYRLSAAGVVRGRPFTAGAMRRIYRLTKGVPRLINVVCDRALLGAFAEGKESVDAKTLKKAAREATGNGSPARTVDAGSPAAKAWSADDGEGAGGKRTGLYGAAAGFILAVLLALGSFYYVYGPGRDRPIHARESRAAPSPKPAEERKEAEAEKTMEGAKGTQAPASLDRPEGQTGASTKAAAYAALLRAWQLPYDPEDRRPLCDQARAAGLACLSGRGSIASLRDMNRPAVLRLVGETNELYYAALTALKGEAATVVIGDETRNVDTGQIARRWSGDYLLLWRMPAEYQGELKMGSGGKGVAWLARQLAVAAGRAAPAEEEGLYDRKMERQVREFQIGAGIVPDGVAGPRTIMRLCGAEGQGRDPVLSDGKGSR